jgi:5-oxoprolinase (ATP-hydrolysing) subunit C
MAPHAADGANRLLDNSLDAPLVELLYSGAKLGALADVWIAVTGADAAANIPIWQVTRVHEGEQIAFREHRLGMWTYLAVEGGLEAERFFGSASVSRRSGIGSLITTGTVLSRTVTPIVTNVSGRAIPPDARRDYGSPPALRVWPGPQWDLFDEASRAALFETPWTVSSQSDRSGYRLTGTPLKARPHELLSEPVLVGSIQVPENGQPIVTMRDGPTVGGYPKLGLVDPEYVSWLAQCAPGQAVRFQLA